MKNVSCLVLRSLDTISVPPEGNIGGEPWQRRRNEKTNKQTKKTQHYLNRAPGSVLPGRCQEFADVFHLFVCQRRPAEVAGSGEPGELRVASLFFFSFFQEVPQQDYLMCIYRAETFLFLLLFIPFNLFICSTQRNSALVRNELNFIDIKITTCALPSDSRLHVTCSLLLLLL